MNRTVSYSGPRRGLLWRSSHPRWALLLGSLLAGLVLFSGCRAEEESAPSEPPPVEEEVDEEGDEKAQEHAEVAELYELPLPPEYFNIQHQKFRVRVATEMDVEEVAQFFEEQAVDVEVFRRSTSADVLPLRSHSGRAKIFNFGGRNGHTVIEYRRPPSLNNQAAADDDEDDDRPEMSEEEQAQAERIAASPPMVKPQSLDEPRLPVWVAEKRGEPVEIRDASGQLVAPGAKWGEPYTPPEGSPLHDERYRRYWGKPYGTW